MTTKNRNDFASSWAWLTGVTALLILSQVGCARLSQSRLPWSSRGSKAPLTESQAELKLAFAKAAEQKGELDHAFSAYQELVAMDLGSSEVHHRIALIHDRKGESKKAEEHYLESLKQNPSAAQVLCDYGYSLYLREAWDASETQYRESIKADPQYMRARVNLGMLLARTERADEALRQFALGGLSEGSAHHNLALAAAEDGDPQTAIAALQQSQEADRGQPATGDHHALAQVVERMATRR